MNASYKALLVILLWMVIGAWLRVPHLGWDSGNSLHPDERGMVFVAESMGWPGQLNPYRDADGGTRPYFYGHLPLYAIRLSEAVVCVFAPGWCDDTLAFDRIRGVARALSTLFDLGTVAVVGMLAFRLRGWQASGLAAGMVSLSPLHIQNATYGTVDTMLAFFCTVAALLMMAFSERPSSRWAALIGAAVGLAVSTKLTGIALLLPLIGVLWPTERRRHWGWALGALVAMFVLTSPYALLDAGQFVRNASTQAAINAGAADVWFTAQYKDALPFVYTLVQMGHWGLSWGVVVLGGIALLAGSLRQWHEPSMKPLLVWAWAGLVIASGGATPFPRYALIVTPTLFVLTAHWVMGQHMWLQAAATALILLSLGVRAVALAGMYTQPHPWVAASQWAYDALPAGTVLLSESRDDALPLAFEQAGLLREAQFETLELRIWEELTADELAAVLAEGEVLIISSRRGYAVLPRRGEPAITAAYYEALFDGALGYTLTQTFERHPHVGPVAFVDAPCQPTALPCPAASSNAPLTYRARLDESFVVYDHPRVLVFENTGQFSQEALRGAILAYTP